MATTQKKYSDTTIKDVWKKAYIVEGINADDMRQDYAGAWIRFVDYGNRNSQYGWEIDHLKPQALNGEDSIENYLPLQWQNNMRKGDNYPRWETAVAADGMSNVEAVKYWKVNS